MVQSILCEGTGEDSYGIFDGIYGRILNQTRGIESIKQTRGIESIKQTQGIESIKNGDKNSIYNHMIALNKSTTVTLANYGSIAKGTAYDLIVEDYLGGITMKKINALDTKLDLSIVEKWYKRFIFMFLILSVGLIIVTKLKISWLPIEVPIIGIIMFMSGAIGMYVDKVRWKERGE